ncbi:MAG TPA: hypothetical protein VLC97_20310, partial [Rhodanobacteraceae bacterium]|nr:hypothetical protein [Rhodanobacteraceae bacterium]
MRKLALPRVSACSRQCRGKGGILMQTSMDTAMCRSFVILCAASVFALALQSPALAGDDIFASGFEYRDFPAAPIVDAGAP